MCINCKCGLDDSGNLVNKDLWEKTNMKQVVIFQNCNSFETFLKSGFYLGIVLIILLIFLLIIPYFMASFGVNQTSSGGNRNFLITASV